MRGSVRGATAETTGAAMRGMQVSFFLEGVAMTRAALLITQLGVRR